MTGRPFREALSEIPQRITRRPSPFSNGIVYGTMRV